jgi:hypothetical protein
MNNYWIGTVSRSHVLRGLHGGFIQLNHGRKVPLQRMKAGDVLALYSPRTDYPDGEPLQAFTALGVIKTGEIYQVEMAEDFKPYRLDVEFLPGSEAKIKPLIPQLSFIKDKTHWGAAFRFGYIKASAADLAVIAEAMHVPLPHAGVA